MKCRHCGVEIQALKNADTHELTWVHVSPDCPYLYCLSQTVATPPETIGEWRDRLFGPIN